MVDAECVGQFHCAVRCFQKVCVPDITIPVAVTVLTAVSVTQRVMCELGL